ncbi:unnamed protein product [Thelazia callipaeda]|uniref:NADH dehydrogenase [ubiquinone] 1 alpha subcomplex subunit 12 n=1 Tax=Thelazia callipaeda TaxID=103827 RepID=A0A0N5CXM3_THECL|nr:unnamed protein product [Thelazia callipaeda]
MGTRRPGVPTFIWRNFVDSLGRDRFKKTIVGEDELGNKYYELTKSKRPVKRGFMSVDKYSTVLPPPEWLTWLRGIRNIPPTPEEIMMNRQTEEKVKKKAKEIDQNWNNLLSHEEGNKIPHVESTTVSSDVDTEPANFPRYPEYEQHHKLT